MTNVIKEFLDSDERKVEKLIEECPVNIPTSEAAKFLGINTASLRAVLESGALGLCWKKGGALNKGFFIPTASFIRWYLRYGDQS